jgi:hypothetical protein
MPIEPVTQSHREISVTEPVSPALERVKTMLFQPFDLGKWFTIGFCAWLAQLGENGGSGFNNGFGNNFNANHGGSPAESLRHVYHQARDYVMDNLVWIIPVAVVVTILLLAIWILILWLSSRGKFMFLHCVALDRAEVAVPWEKFGRAADSLFWFRLVLGLCAMILMLPMLVIIGVTIWGMVARGEPDVAGILLAAGLGLAFFGLAIVCALIQKFTMDFVVPIQFLRGGKCLAAWREFGRLLADHAGLFALYILFQIVLGIAIGIIVVGAVLITCCIAGCLMLIPYLGTVLLLPVLIFKRSYSLYFLRQFGPSFDAFSSAPPVAPVSGLQPAPTV